MMTADDMARLHARAFAGQGRAWSVAEMAGMLASRHVISATLPHAFALVRVIADEAELLMLATDPDYRRQGLARACLARAEAAAGLRQAAQIFLEVAHDNTVAIALYRAAGYTETGRRAGYYRRPDGSRADAVTMFKPLGRDGG